jgi:hypothetical protein
MFTFAGYEGCLATRAYTIAVQATFNVVDTNKQAAVLFQAYGEL